MKKLFYLFPLLALLVFQACQKTESVIPNDEPLLRSNCQHKITVPDGSVDVLQAAVDDLCEGGTITLAAGMHTENAMVVINKRLTLKGEADAVLEVSSTSGTNDPTVALHVLDAQNVRIEGFELLPTGDDGGVAVLLQNANHATVKNCVFRRHTISIVLEQSDHVEISGNLVESLPYSLEDGLLCHGIVVINGEKARISNNEVFYGFWGVWACDKDGTFKNNYTHHNFAGLILCKVGVNYLTLPDGTQVGAEFSATNWQVSNNLSTDNGLVGYLVIDGANNNHLNNNQGGNNATTYDIELKGRTSVLGPCLPTSYDNLVNAGSYDVLIKDCGENNTIIGGTQVDTSVDPCDPSGC